MPSAVYLQIDCLEIMKSCTVIENNRSKRGQPVVQKQKLFHRAREGKVKALHSTSLLLACDAEELRFVAPLSCCDHVYSRLQVIYSMIENERPRKWCPVLFPVSNNRGVSIMSTL